MSWSVRYVCDRPGCHTEEELPIQEVLCDERDRLRPLTTLAGLLPVGWDLEHDTSGDDVLVCPNHRREYLPRRREHGSEDT